MKKTKIIFTADIHLGKTAYQSWEIEAEKIRNEKADIFVIGGDMSPSTKNFIDTFNIFDDVAKHHYYVIGNHDIWIVDGGKDGDSFIKYESLIKKQLNGFTCLDNAPVIYTTNDGVTIGLVGNIGWYDYSFRDKKIDILYPLAMNMYKQKKFPNGKIKWMDGEYAKWGESDEYMVDYFAKRLDDHIKKLGNVDIICCFMHHVPFEKMMKKGSDQWNMGNAFSGSKKIENVIRQYDKIKYVFCGHTHTKFHGNLYNKECFNVGVDYHEPRYIVV